jgi:hypothetical protein
MPPSVEPRVIWRRVPPALRLAIADQKTSWTATAYSAAARLGRANCTGVRCAPSHCRLAFGASLGAIWGMRISARLRGRLLRCQRGSRCSAARAPRLPFKLIHGGRALPRDRNHSWRPPAPPRCRCAPLCLGRRCRQVVCSRLFNQFPLAGWRKLSKRPDIPEPIAVAFQRPMACP